MEWLVCVSTVNFVDLLGSWLVDVGLRKWVSTRE